MKMRRWIDTFRPLLEILEQRLAPANAALLQAYGQLPLSFEANQGQTAAEVQYLTQTNGGTLFLTSTGAVLSLTGGEGEAPSLPFAAAPFASDASPGSRLGGSLTVPNGLALPETGVALDINFVGANPNAAVVGIDQQPGISNYFIGNDPSQWHNNIPNYAKVEYQNVYPGINLVYYGNQQQLEYDYQLTPGADPSSIRFAVQGADSLSLDAKGDLVLHTAIGDVLEHAPVVYQQIAGIEQPVSGHFVLLGNNEVGFQVGAYDASKALVIDPVLSYSTYLGGNSEDEGFGIAVDGSGNAYVTGTTYSTNFPTTAGVFQTSIGGNGNAFVTKLNASGTAVVYSTYMGGSTTDFGNGIAVDGSGDAFVTGIAYSTNFPTTAGAFQTSHASDGGNDDAFVTKLNASGTGLVYSTYLGGNSHDLGTGIAVDDSGYAYVTGYTSSTDFPTTTGDFQSSHASDAGAYDAFVSKLNASGTGLVYSTYLGGNSNDYGKGIAVDGSGDAFVTGYTQSTNFATTVGAFQTSSDGNYDAFVTELNAGGAALVYSTYLGGSLGDLGQGIAVDGSGNAYVTGFTSSTNFPTTAGAFQTSHASDSGGDDAFIAKLNASGTALVYSTYLGGSGNDLATAIAIDASGNAYVTGYTGSANFPTTADAVQTAIGAGFDAFLTKLNADGTAPVYSTYRGGNSGDYGEGIAIDGSENVYVTGSTYSTTFPTTTGVFQTSHASDGNSLDAFVTKFAFASPTTTNLTDNGPNPSNFGDAVSFTATVSGGSNTDGETVFIEDADAANAVVASPTLSDGSATFAISTLSVGTHHLFAVYNGDATNAASNSSATPVTQMVIGGTAPIVVSAIVNGGTPAYTDSQGNSSFGLVGQNSIVEQILVTFNEGVTLAPGAFSIINNAAGVTVVAGETPNTLAVNAVWGAPVAGSGNTQWIVTFSGPGTTPLAYGGSGSVIKDGLYKLHVSAADVIAITGGLPMAADSDTGFWAMYGAVHDNTTTSTIGDGNSEVFLDSNDFNEFVAAFNSGADSSLPTYDVAMDYDLDGFYDADTFNAFVSDFNAGNDWVF